MSSFDFVVLGGGSGGIAAARRAARYGAKVLLIEAGDLGGTCVNRGCVPKKHFWNAAYIAETLHYAGAHGFKEVPPTFEFDRFSELVRGEVRRLNGIYEANLEREGVTLIRGWGRLLGSGRVMVDGQEYHGKHVLLASGGRPRRPKGIIGEELGLTSDDFFLLKEQPKRVLIVGAGYIAAEFASVLQSLGSEVSLMVRRDRVLGDFDDSLSQGLTAEIAEKMTLLTQTNATKLERRSDGVFVSVDGARGPGEIGPFDAVFWAIGRDPNTDGLGPSDGGLESIGVKLDGAGAIVTDQYENTTLPGVYAVGDVTGKVTLTPVAIAAGRKLADRLFGGQPDAHLDYSLVPTVIFSHPPIGTVGLSEAAAVERFPGQVKVYSARFTDSYYSFANPKPKTSMKLVCVGEEERIVGLHVLGRSADEMVQGFAVALRMGATKADFDRTVAIHPTASEEFVTMR